MSLFDVLPDKLVSQESFYHQQSWRLQDLNQVNMCVKLFYSIRSKHNEAFSPRLKNAEFRPTTLNQF